MTEKAQLDNSLMSGAILEAALHDSAPKVTTPPGANLVVAGLAAEIASSARGQALPSAEATSCRAPARPRFRRRSLRAVTGIVAATLLLSGGVAMAAEAWHSARTGEFGAPGMTEGDESEWIDPSAPDYSDVVAALLPDNLLLPPGVNTQDAIDRVIADGKQVYDSPGSNDVELAQEQETGVRSHYMFFAMCQWSNYWAAGGDAVQSAKAIEAFIDSPLMAAIDGGNLRDSERFMLAEAQDGNLAAVQYRRVRAGCIDTDAEAIKITQQFAADFEMLDNRWAESQNSELN
jgi:hypothetical protein